MQYFSSDSKDCSSDKHNSENISVTSEAENEMSQDAKHGWYDQNYSCSYLIDEDSSQKGDDDIGECVEGIEQVKFELCDIHVICC